MATTYTNKALQVNSGGMSTLAVADTLEFNITQFNLGGADAVAVLAASATAISIGSTGNPTVAFLGTGAITFATTSITASALTTLSAPSAVSALSSLALGGASIGADKLAVTGNANISSDLTVGGNLTVNGTTVTVSSTVVEITDNMITVNSGPSASKDAGFKVERYQTANDGGTGDVATDAAALESTIATIGAQTGMTSTQVTLTGGSGTDNYYNGMWLKVTSGSSINQVRKVTGYVGSSRVATIASAWTTQNPGATDSINIYSPWVGIVYDESADEFAVAHLAGAAGLDADLDRVALRTGGLAVDDTLVVTGASTFTGATAHNGGLTATSGSFSTTLDVSGASTFGTTLGVTGVSTFTGGFTSAAASTVSAGGLSVTGGLNNNSGGITNAGTISGATTLTMTGALAGATTGGFSGAVSSAGLTLTTTGITMTGLDIGGTGAEIGNIYLAANKGVRLSEGIAPTFEAANGWVYSKVGAGTRSELWWMDDTGAELQITEAGAINLGSLNFTLDDAYNDGHTITVDAGPIVLNTSTTIGGTFDINPSGPLSETAAQIDITWAAGVYTGTTHGIIVDLSPMTSLSNASDVYGAKLVGKTNDGVGDSVGLYVASFDKAAVLSGSLTQSGGAFSLSGDAGPSSIATSTGSLTIQTTSSGSLSLSSGGAGSWATMGGPFNTSNLSIASGNSSSGSSGSISIAAGTASTTVGAVSIDGGAITIGTVASTSIGLGKSGVTTTITGGLTQLTGAVSLSGNAASSLTTSAGALTLTSAVAATWSTTAGLLTISGGSGVEVDVSVSTATAFAVQQGANKYIALDTTVSTEKLGIGNSTILPNILFTPPGAAVGTGYSYMVSYNASADVAMAVGDIVYVTATGVDKANATTSATGLVCGIVAGDSTSASFAATSVVDLGDKAFVAAIPGQVVSVNTSMVGWSAGAAVYLSTTAGQITNVAPAAAGNIVFRVGFVLMGGAAGTGKILYMPQYMYAVA